MSLTASINQFLKLQFRFIIIHIYFILLVLHLLPLLLVILISHIG